MSRRTRGWTRRGVLAAGTATAAVAATGFPAPAVAVPRTLRIGFVTPRTGAIAVFAEPDDFALEHLKKAIGPGIRHGDLTYPVEIIVKDSQSNPNRAAEVAQELIVEHEVDIITATSTPDTTNPVANVAELEGVPCVTNDTPWQPHFFGRRGDPKKGFEWTYHFFWGLEDVIAVYTGMWEKIETNRVVGALWPNDDDGLAWGDPRLGFPPVLAEKGFTLVDPGRFEPLTDDFSAIIATFRDRGVEIVTGVVVPPDFTTFWTQAAQQGLRPKAVTVGKATEFPQAIKALGKRGDGLSVEVWWSPHHPFRSSLTGESSKEYAEAYEKATGRPWTMPLGFKHSLFEVALDALKRAEDLDSPESIRDAIANTALDTIVGHIDFRTGPVPNIAKTPLVGGQWTVEEGREWPRMDIVENGIAPMIPLTGEMRPITHA